MQCGIACLSMICHHYKKNYSIETLSKYCIATHQGVSLFGMSKADNEFFSFSKYFDQSNSHLYNLLTKILLQGVECYNRPSDRTQKEEKYNT